MSAPDYRQVPGGTVINMRFDPEHFKDEAGADRFIALIRVAVKKRIPQLQFNFTTNETLRLARQNPDAYRDLVVRVSGFSAYFVTLGSEAQDDIMRRRAHV